MDRIEECHHSRVSESKEGGGNSCRTPFPLGLGSLHSMGSGHEEPPVNVHRSIRINTANELLFTTTESRGTFLNDTSEDYNNIIKIIKNYFHFR